MFVALPVLLDGIQLAENRQRYLPEGDHAERTPGVNIGVGFGIALLVVNDVGSAMRVDQ